MNDLGFPDKHISAKLPFSSVLGPADQLLSGVPQEARSDNKQDGGNGQDRSQSDKPSIGIRFIVAFCGLIGTFLLSALGHRLYFYNKRQLLGVALICAGALSGFGGLWLLISDRVIWGWL